MVLGGAASEAAEQGLYALVEGDPSLGEIMRRYGATGQTLKKIYGTLRVMGAGQWVRGHWVPASALAFGPSLTFVLESTRNGQDRDEQLWTYVAFRLITYFERGEIGTIEPVQRDPAGAVIARRASTIR